MTYKEIISSGLLEQYAIGLLTPVEITEVERYLDQYPELIKELNKIQLALGNYALEQGIEAPAGIKDKILSQLKVTSSSSLHKEAKATSGQKSNWIDYLSALFLAGMLILLWNNRQLSRENTEIKKQWMECDSMMNKTSVEADAYAAISKAENQIVAFEATPGYKETTIYLVQDTIDRKNYIQMVNIPELSEEESLQLWSLKPGADPIPLNVFRKENSIFLEVSFEDGTEAYAVTIEPKEGSSVPNLKKLVGVAKV